MAEAEVELQLPELEWTDSEKIAVTPPGGDTYVLDLEPLDPPRDCNWKATVDRNLVIIENGCKGSNEVKITGLPGFLTLLWKDVDGEVEVLDDDLDETDSGIVPN